MSYPLGVRCYWIAPTERARLGLRRYHMCDDPRKKCDKHGYHNAITFVTEVSMKRVAEPNGSWHWEFGGNYVFLHTDGRWPKRCDCGYEFAERDVWQVWHEPLYRRTDTGADTTLRTAGPGAMWNADWMGDWVKGPDGQCLVVRLPNGNDWMIDSRASNCDSPCVQCGRPYHSHSVVSGHHYEDVRPHQCWVRTGKPPRITVSKQGVTCGAGSGSIQSGSYHGFLRDGRFEP